MNDFAATARHDPKHVRAMVHMLEQEADEGPPTFTDFIKVKRVPGYL
jgi:hypothetical protein